MRVGACLHVQVYGVLQVPVVVRRQHDVREQVREDAMEQHNVLRHELREVRVPAGPDERDVLVQVGAAPLQAPGHYQNGLEGPHPEVVVVLRGQLLRRQLEQLRDLE